MEAGLLKLEWGVQSFNALIAQEGWQAFVETNATSPIFKRGLEFLANREDLLLAICLNNGYYNRESIYRMLRFSLAFSKRVQVFFTDGPAKHNYRAKGMDEYEIVRECRLQRNRLRNHCVRALERINMGKEAYAVTFVEWGSIYADSQYQGSYNYLKTLYTDNSAFQIDIDSATRKVLENRIGQTMDIESKISIAIEYVLEELAFILSYSKLNSSSKPIANHGANGFNYIYYEPWFVFENLVNGLYDNRVHPEIGFALVKV